MIFIFSRVANVIVGERFPVAFRRPDYRRVRLCKPRIAAKSQFTVSVGSYGLLRKGAVVSCLPGNCVMTAMSRRHHRSGQLRIFGPMMNQKTDGTGQDDREFYDR
jgi:hypothetical protein